MADTWTKQRALEIAAEFLTRTGLCESECRLVSFRQNAVFHLADNRTALRIYNPDKGPTSADLMVRCAEWLEAEQFPTARLSPVLTEQPLAVAEYPISCWQWVDGTGDGANQPFAFGKLLRRLHDLRSEPACTIPPLNPLGKIETRLERLHGAEKLNANHLMILDHAFEEAKSLQSGTENTALGSGVLHGDAIPSNATMTGGGLILMDMDSVCFGPREWDLVPMSVVCLRYGKGGVPAWREFLAGYGHGESELPDLNAARFIKQLSMTVYLCLSAGLTPAIDAEIERRLDMWANADHEGRWHSAF